MWQLFHAEVKFLGPTNAEKNKILHIIMDIANQTKFPNADNFWSRKMLIYIKIDNFIEDV